MPSFLDDISSFYGTGEKNEKGQTLEEFLKEYDPYQYKNPCATTDMVLFSYAGEKPDTHALKVLLVCRKNHPSIGYWALPGGFVELYENLEDTARRELEEETGVKGLPVEQFACYGDYQRDPRARVITTAYFSLVNEKEVRVKAGDDAADAAWFTVKLKKGESRDVTTDAAVIKKEDFSSIGFLPSGSQPQELCSGPFTRTDLLVFYESQIPKNLEEVAKSHYFENYAIKLT